MIFFLVSFSQDPPFRVTPRPWVGEITCPRLCIIPLFQQFPIVSIFFEYLPCNPFILHPLPPSPSSVSAYVPIGPVTQGASRAPSYCTLIHSTRTPAHQLTQTRYGFDGSAAKSGPYHPHSPSSHPCPHSPFEFPNGLRVLRLRQKKKRKVPNMCQGMEFVERIEYKMGINVIFVN